MLSRSNHTFPASNRADTATNGHVDEDQARGPKSALIEVGDLLRQAEQQCREAAAGIAPEIRPGQTTCERYARALSNWPSDAQPSYEWLARLLSQVHQLEGAISVAIVRAEAAAGLMSTALEDDDTRLDRNA